LRYAILSDVHANLEALTVVLARIDSVGVDKTICLGDIVGYNANPNECVEQIRARNIPSICGNHDAVACGMTGPWGFNPIAQAAAIWTRENLTRENAEWLRTLKDSLQFDNILAVHGSPSDRDMYMFGWEDVLFHMGYLKDRRCTLCFFGHTHCPGIFSEDGVYTVDNDSKFTINQHKEFFINPGSVGQPRDGDPRAAFGLLDTETHEFELVRVAYSIKQAAEKISKVGLPHFLGDRLFLGR